MSNKTVESIVCDHCGKELIQSTSFPAIYALQLGSINVNRNRSNMVVDVICHDPMKENCHFCGFLCLHDWAAALPGIRNQLEKRKAAENPPIVSPENADLVRLLESKGYYQLRETRHGIVGLMNLIFAVGIAVGLHHAGCRYCYCYKSLGDAVGALSDWSKAGYEGEPEGYIVRKGEGGDKRPAHNTPAAGVTASEKGESGKDLNQLTGNT